MPNRECIYQIPALPPPVELDTHEFLKALTVAHRSKSGVKIWGQVFDFDFRTMMLTVE